MSIRSEAKIVARREEIINACQRLYSKMSFKEITLKEISKETTFSRTSIYNYFQTKEEIFLSLLKREYDFWVADLKSVCEASDSMESVDFAEALAKSLEKRAQLLKILSMNHYDLEENCRIEHLVSFKQSYGSALKQVEAILIKFFPKMDSTKRRDFIYTFFPFMFGIYPYTVVSEKQKKAMAESEVNFNYNSLYDFIFRAVKRMLESNI